MAWATTVWPCATEAYFFDALPRLAGNIDWSSAEWENVVFFELLREPTTALGELGRLALAIGLSAKESGENGVSADAAMAAMDQGRIDGNMLGETMAALRPTGFVKLKRWTRTLGIVAQTSASHAACGRTAIERCLRGDPKQAPRDDGPLVDLLLDLLAQANAKVADHDAWTYLGHSRHQKKFAEFAP